MLHTEEFEIIVPDSPDKGDRTPAFLRIGPMTSMLIPVVVMALFASRMYKSSTGSFIYFGMISAFSSAVSGILWAVFASSYKKKQERLTLNKAAEDFARYIAGVREHLSSCTRENREYMFERYRSSVQIADSDNVHRRYEGASDRFFIRLGTGKTAFQMKFKISGGKKELFESNELSEANAVIREFETLTGVPVGIELKDGDCIGITGTDDPAAVRDLILDMLIKISDQYSERKVKVCIFFDENIPWQSELYESVKFMPHLFAQGGAVRLAAGNNRDSPEIIPYISERLLEKEERFIVFILNGCLIKGEIVEDMLLAPSDGHKCASVFLSDKESNLPVHVGKVITLPPKGVKNLTVSDLNVEGPKAGILGDVPPPPMECGYYMRRLFRDLSGASGAFDEIPQSVGFLKLYDASSVSDIDIVNKWRNDHPEERLRVPIGLGVRCEKVYLDVHERFCGPHGLIAGTTGSGKSELLQTYLISLCLSFSPDDVNFFIIDYKGGGTGNALSDLPHCAGVISNLSGSMIKRAMSAIRSENEQRQRLLSESGVNHIDEYNRLRRKDDHPHPLPHLLLIIDEFAELRKEEPDFMREIISLSAVGRSLGIHLILATQKPSGVIDDRIWSNSRFKLCLKVQDRQDSMDMLKRPEAAYLKRSGQCYMQIGLDEYFKCFQTGYLGEAYEEGEKEKKVSYVGRSGKRIGAPGVRTDKGMTVLDALRDLILRTAENEGYEKCPLLWTDELPDIISDDETEIRTILGKDASFERNDDSVLLGIYDDPSNQRKGILAYDPLRCAHLAISGCPASGKTNILRTVAHGLHNCELILIDLSGGPLYDLKDLPNCKGSLFSRDGLRVFFHHLEKCFVKREDPLFILIDNFGLFFKSLGDEHSSLIVRMVSEGIGNNIFFIVTGNTVSDFPPSVFSKIKTTLCLEMTDKFGYADMLRHYRLDVVPKNGVPGRGLCRIDNCIYEFQSLICRGGEHTGFIEARDRFPSKEGAYALSAMIEESRRSKPGILPVGYSALTGYIRGMDMSRPASFLIMGNPYECLALLSNIQKSVASLFPELYERCVFARDADELGSLPAEGEDAPATRSDDVEEPDVTSAPYPGGSEDKYYFLIYTVSRMKSDGRSTDLMKRIIREGQGIYIGNDALSQNIFDFSDVPFRELGAPSDEPKGFMKIAGRKKTIRILIPTDKKECEDDDND
ncbi:MAG: hypothetical protein K5888_12675 [Lachnospiraceae bacterium]|nr:hypothetical protein [Lachnospiraceae bacterium]